MEKEGWKTTAIVLEILLIIETLLFAGIITLGLEEIRKDEECQYDICADSEAYFYEVDICYCFEDGEITHQKYIGG